MQHRLVKHLTGCVLMAVIAAAIGLPRALAADDDIHEAKVVRAGGGSLEIVEKDGDNVKLSVPATAKITRNDKKAALEDLKQGDIVEIKVTRSDGKLVATSIQARAPE